MQAARTAKDSMPVTGICQLTVSFEIIISTADVISESTDSSITGNRLRLCRSKSVYSRRQTAISDPKQIIETTFETHPDVIKTSISTSMTQLCTIALVNWLIRLYSIISGETNIVQIIKSAQITMTLHAFPPDQAFNAAHSSAESRNMSFVIPMIILRWLFLFCGFGYVLLICNELTPFNDRDQAVPAKKFIQCFFK